MINNIKGELEKRTGLPANVVDQVVNTLGEIVGERYPQYAGIIGPMLGISTAQGGATGTPGGMNLPDLGNLGGIFGGQSDQNAQDNTTTNKG